MASRTNFFISYTRKDRLWAEWIGWQLEQSGFTTMIQSWDNAVNFTSKIDNAIINSDRYIIIISPAYFASEWCAGEWTAALAKDPENRNGTLVPVRVEECTPKGLLAPIVYTDLLGLNEKKASEVLFIGINPPGKPVVKPTFPGRKASALKTGPAFPLMFPENNLPQRNNSFTGRKDIIDGISKCYESGNYAALTQAAPGPGGIGKTQIAVEYAYRQAGRYDVIRFINAESFDSLLLGYTEFAKEKGLTGGDVYERDVIVNSVKSWMTKNDRWLFIFDNADRPGDIREYLPGINGGNVLVTSRNETWSNLYKIPVGVFRPDEAVDFLVKSTRSEDREGAARLSEELGFFPLALEYAAAYITSGGYMGYFDYLELFRKTRFKILGGETSRSKDYVKTISVAWNISLAKIRNEGAKQLLNILSYFSDVCIEKSFFTDCSGLLPEPLSKDAKNELEYNNVIFELARFSLIRSEGDSLCMHRLLKESVRSGSEKKRWLQVCLGITQEKLKLDQNDSRTWKEFSSFLGQALSIAAYAEEEGEALEEAGRIYCEAGGWFTQAASYPEALELLDKAKGIAEKISGEGHPNTAKALNNIGGVYFRQGEYDKALEWFSKALVIREAALGKDHPDTAAVYCSIASVYRKLLDFDKALEWYGKALEVYGKVLGKEHPDTAAVYNSIAEIYKEQGENDKALEWYGKALDIYEKVLGRDPDTVSAYNSIASVYNAKKEYIKALEWYRKALDIAEKALGKDHPQTAATYIDIAALYEGDKEYDKALEWYEKALDIRERVLGKEHPETALVYGSIAAVYSDQGDHQRALEWYAKALGVNEKILGKDHPETAKTFSSMAAVHYRQGDHKKALELLIKSLVVYVRKQMTGYPDAKEALSTLYLVYVNAGGRKEDFQKWLAEKLK